MNKTDLVKGIIEKINLSSSERQDPMSFKRGREFLDAFVEVVSEELKENGKVALSGFGTIYVKERKARVGVNPRTGAALNIPACRIPAFRAGKILKHHIG